MNHSEGLSQFISRVMSECEAEGRDVSDWELRKMYDHAKAMECDMQGVGTVLSWLVHWRRRLEAQTALDPLYYAAFDSIIIRANVKPLDQKVARALAAVEVYEQHKDQLDYISSQRQRYNMVNRNVMTKTVQRFHYEMEVALRGDPEVKK